MTNKNDLAVDLAIMRLAQAIMGLARVGTEDKVSDDAIYDMARKIDLTVSDRISDRKEASMKREAS